MKKAPGQTGAGSGQAGTAIVADRRPCPDAPVAVFVRTLQSAARNPAVARRVNLALQRAALYDNRPRDSLREHADARQPDRRLEPYLSALNRYAERRENPQ